MKKKMHCDFCKKDLSKETAAIFIANGFHWHSCVECFEPTDKNFLHKIFPFGGDLTIMMPTIYPRGVYI